MNICYLFVYFSKVPTPFLPSKCADSILNDEMIWGPHSSHFSRCTIDGLFLRSEESPLFLRLPSVLCHVAWHGLYFLASWDTQKLPEGRDIGG